MSSKVHAIGTQTIGDLHRTACNTFMAGGMYAVSVTDVLSEVTCKSCLKNLAKSGSPLNAENDAHKPCNPCLRDDHDNCTGDCPSMCCALAMAESECESLRVELAEARVTQLKLADRYTETFAQLSAMESANTEIRDTLNAVALQRDAKSNTLRAISAIHRSGTDDRCEACGDESPCATVMAISGETS